MIIFDIGGEEFVLSKETLKKYPESLLHEMISGEVKDIIFTDKGHVFIDRNPNLFKFISLAIQNDFHDYRTPNDSSQN